MHNDPTHAASPSRRSVAKGAAWALPVLTTAGVAPSLAASNNLECTSQQAINDAITVVKTKTAKLQLNFYSPWEYVNGGDSWVYVNLKNKGTSPIAASESDPIIVQVTFRSVNQQIPERRIASYASAAWGTVAKSPWANSQTTITWTIQKNIPVFRSARDEADLRVHIGTTGPNVHVLTEMDSFGPNDNLKPSDFPALDKIPGADQTIPCQDYHTAQVQANLTAAYTLLAAGSYTSGDGVAWPVKTIIDSRTIGNYAPGLLGYARDGIW